MPTPDVRVRMSAEGVADVVSAFKKIQQEAERTKAAAGHAASGVEALSEQLKSLKELLPALSAGAAVAGLIELGKRTFDSAENLGKLSEKTALTVETLSVLALAAKRAGVEQESLSGGLVKATKFFAQYDNGATGAREAVKKLFGSSAALQGLTTDEKLKKVIDQLAKMGPTAQRTFLALQVFGRGGAELIPVLEEIGEGGFGAMEKKARSLGVVLDTDVLDSIKATKEAMADLQATAQGAMTGFLAGFLPGLTQAINAMLAAINGAETSAKGLQQSGALAGQVVRWISLAVSYLGIGVGAAQAGVIALLEMFADFGTGVVKIFVGVGEAMVDVFSMGPKKAAEKFAASVNTNFAEPIRQFMAKTAGIGEAAAKAAKAVDDAWNRPPDKTRKHQQEVTSTAVDPENLKAAKILADALLKFSEAQLSNELTLLKAANKATSDEEKRRYEEGLVDLETYYHDRAARIQAESEKEISVLQSKRAELLAALAAEAARKMPETGAETATAEQQKRLLEIAASIDAIDTKISVSQIQQANEIAASAAEQLKATRALRVEQLASSAEFLTLEGKRGDAALKHIEEQIAGTKRQEGENEQLFLARKKQLETLLTAQARFNELSAKSQDKTNALSTEQAMIQAQITQGKLSELEGQQQIIAAQLKSLPKLHEIANLMSDTAFTEPQIAAAAQFQAQVAGIEGATKKLSVSWGELRTATEHSLQSGLFDFFSQGIDQATSFGDAMRGLGLSIVNSLRQAVAQMLATMITMKAMAALKKLLGMDEESTPAKGGGGGFASLLSGLFGFGGKAGGGLIHGPGTGTSDSVFGRLSAGEFVVREAVVRQPGVLAALSDLNRGMGSISRRYAGGGLVPSGQFSGGGPAPRASNAGLTATLDIDPALVLRRLEASSEFSRVLIRTAKKNQKRFGAALNVGG